MGYHPWGCKELDTTEHACMLADLRLYLSSIFTHLVESFFTDQASLIPTDRVNSSIIALFMDCLFSVIIMFVAR